MKKLGVLLALAFTQSAQAGNQIQDSSQSKWAYQLGDRILVGSTDNAGQLPQASSGLFWKVIPYFGLTHAASDHLTFKYWLDTPMKRFSDLAVHPLGGE